jgi:hypothetical protein
VTNLVLLSGDTAKKAKKAKKPLARGGRWDNTAAKVRTFLEKVTLKGDELLGRSFADRMSSRIRGTTHKAANVVRAANQAEKGNLAPILKETGATAAAEKFIPKMPEVSAPSSRFGGVSGYFIFGGVLAAVLAGAFLLTGGDE